MLAQCPHFEKFMEFLPEQANLGLVVVQQHLSFHLLFLL